MGKDLIDFLHSDFFNFPLVSSMTPVFKDADILRKPHGMPSPDIIISDDDIRINIPVAGYESADLEVFMEQGVLNIVANKKDLYSEGTQFIRRGISLGGFKWKLKLDHTVDEKGMSAEMRNGILFISLPKRETEKIKSIPIKNM